MAKTYKGQYKVKNTKKYKGNPTHVIYRSMWERNVFKWLDEHSEVLEWNSEEVIVPYRCPTDNKIHRYFVDIYVKFKNGTTHIIEIKPHKQTLPPTKPSKKNQKYIEEVLTYVKNQAKWEAAQEYAIKRGWMFSVWTENEMDEMGIPRMKALPRLKRKKPAISRKRRST